MSTINNRFNKKSKSSHNQFKQVLLLSSCVKMKKKRHIFSKIIHDIYGLMLFILSSLISVSQDKGVKITVIGIGKKVLGAEDAMKEMAGSRGTVHLYASIDELSKHFDEMLAASCGKFASIAFHTWNAED